MRAQHYTPRGRDGLPVEFNCWRDLHAVSARIRRVALFERHWQLSKLTFALVLFAASVFPLTDATAAGLLAGVAKADITDRQAGPVNDPLYVKALVLTDGTTTIALITVDAVAIGEIGRIGNDYLPTVRTRLKEQLGIAPTDVLVNASHCHGVVRDDVADLTVQAVAAAAQNMVPVKVGAGSGHEDRIMENRRLKLADGHEADVRHAYALPPDEAVTAVGPIDPEIGVLRLDRADDRPLAVVYNFACHPIQGVPGGGNTADLVGFASGVIEDNLADDTMAFFLQGCAGDINPVWYKDVDHPRDARPLGNTLGLSTLRAVRKIETHRDDRLELFHEVVALPRADTSARIAELETRREQLVRSLRGTSLNFETFMHLYVKHRLSPEYPSYYSHRYLHDEKLGRDDLRRLDKENRRNMERYLRNVHIMEELTRLQANLALLRKHQATNEAAARPTIDAELLGLRIGDFVLIAFPGELSVQIGLNIKKASPYEHTFVAGYSNGYLYYTPTAEQLENVGRAQEDSECLLAPEWQRIFEEKVAEVLGRL